MKTTEAVRNRILKLCQQRNMTINRLATVSALPPSSIKNILYGKSRNPKLLTIKLICDGLGITLVQFFTAPEFDNLEQELDLKVMDRTLIILDIFAAHARTSEGKIQVELAQLKYRQARLVGLRNSLSRLGGGIGTRGPGEKKLEMDRRLIKNRIAQLNRELREVKRHRELTREQRTKNRIPVVAIVGYTNAGKSTLINKILGEDRLLTGPEAGITRDSISVTTEFMGTPVRIFDTAGMRKRARVTDKVEKLSVADGLRAVRFAEVVVVLLDVGVPFEQQDLRIADFAETEGRAVVVAANKWDLEEDKPEKLKELRESFERLLPQLKGAPLVTVSARTGKGLDRLHNAILKAHEVWNRRVPTARLNQWLSVMTEAHPPPAPGGRRIRLRYMTQVKTRPPAFVVMATHTDKLPDSYARYLVNGLRVDFDMPGTPIRLTFRDQGTKNPYLDKANKINQSGALSKHKNRQKPKST